MFGGNGGRFANYSFKPGIVVHGRHENSMITFFTSAALVIYPRWYQPCQIDTFKAELKEDFKC